MPTPFDWFGPEAGHGYDGGISRRSKSPTGSCSETMMENVGGFTRYDAEWWHYTYAPRGRTATARFPDEVNWPGDDHEMMLRSCSSACSGHVRCLAQIEFIVNTRRTRPSGSPGSRATRREISSVVWSVPQSGRRSLTGTTSPSDASRRQEQDRGGEHWSTRRSRGSQETTRGAMNTAGDIRGRVGVADLTVILPSTSRRGSYGRSGPRDPSSWSTPRAADSQTHPTWIWIRPAGSSLRGIPGIRTAETAVCTPGVRTRRVSRGHGVPGEHHDRLQSGAARGPVCRGRWRLSSCGNRGSRTAGRRRATASMGGSGTRTGPRRAANSRSTPPSTTTSGLPTSRRSADNSMAAVWCSWEQDGADGAIVLQRLGPPTDRRSGARSLSIRRRSTINGSPGSDGSREIDWRWSGRAGSRTGPGRGLRATLRSCRTAGLVRNPGEYDHGELPVGAGFHCFTARTRFLPCGRAGARRGKTTRWSGAGCPPAGAGISFSLPCTTRFSGRAPPACSCR